MKHMFEFGQALSFFMKWNKKQDTVLSLGFFFSFQVSGSNGQFTN